MKLFGDNPITNFLVGQLENVAANAYVRDDVKYRSDRYKMGDPDKVHPFDNKAHKVLTEVIPAYLGKISAGVNHTEEEVFDFKQNVFVPARVFRNRIKQAREEVLHRTEGYSQFKTNFEDLSGKYGENLKGNEGRIRDVIKKFADSAETETTFKKTKYTNEDGSLNTAAMSKIIPTMMENYLKYGLSFDVDRELRGVRFKYEDGEYVEGTYSGVVLNSTDLKTTYERKAACDLFYSAIRKMRSNSGSSQEEKDLWTSLVVASNSYTSRLSDANMEAEERNSKYGNSIIHDSFTSTEEIDRQLRNEIDSIERRQKQLKKIEYDEDGKPKAGINDLSRMRNASQKMAESKERVLDLNMRRGELSSRINDGLDNVDDKYMTLSGGKIVENEDENFNNYRISSLEDSSTHGLVQNIYNLLLSGIDVYTTPKENMPDERRAFLKQTKSRLVEKSVTKMKQKSERDDLSTYIRCTKPYPNDPNNVQDWFRENYIDVDYTGNLWYKVDNDWEK
ncbi:MAG: hypothetical protein K2N99_00765, partial [Malacoplasma sp.]|nr:hypothetical protein [Malacoplasma sp.]